MTDSPAKPIVLGVTGASGAIYARRLLHVLFDANCDIHLSISPSGKAVFEQELGVTIDLDNFSVEHFLGTTRPTTGRLTYHHFKNLMAPIASGSFLTNAMVLCPCSGSTLSAITHSMGENLIHRAAEVHLKERRKLIVVPRETPLSLPQLKNMQAIHEAGAVVLPASPGFYHNAQTIDDLVNFVVARICDQLNISNELVSRWGN